MKPFAAVRLFYAAPLALSLMLGKFCFAAPQNPAGDARAPVSLTTSIDAGDRSLLTARDAFERRNFKTLDAARAEFRGRLAGHPLAGYVEYWWLMANLGQASSFAATNAADFSQFLSAQPDGPLTDSLRREWLRALGKAERWDTFAAQVSKLQSDDADIACLNWKYRLATGDREAVGEARAFWNAARQTPEACDEVFAQINAEKALTTDSKWSRVRRLLEANLLAEARRSAPLIDKLPAAFERTTASIGIDPRRYLEKEKLNSKSQSSIELYLFAVTRAARSDAAKTAALIESRAAGLPPSDLGYAWAQVGLYGAMQHEPAALSWFERAGPLNDTQAAWKARAALRAGDWRAVRAAIEAMSAAEKRDAAWRYWLARAEAAQGNAAAAQQLRESLVRENNFYGLLAAEESGPVTPPAWRGWRPSAQELDAMRQRPGIVRALALYRLEMKNEGLREWQHAIRNLDDQQLLAAAEVARVANVPDRAINTAERTLMVHDFSQRFPMPHRADLQAQAKAQGLDEAWVYGLIRQESRFMADAKSRVGATGLMQLMPATAKWAAKQVGMSGYTPQRTGDIAVNLALGSFYLRHVLDGLGHPVLATAAYNAGPGRARRWQSSQALEGAIYAESIPFNETRDYVKKVMANAWFYAHQAGGTQISLKQMIGTVPGRQDNQGNSSLVSALDKSISIPALTPASTTAR
ncbi:MAG: lytic transglycosylase domain-containing protein [Betaproteobacteria bacterium]|nr:lytic transglycosylase domain-containing protein [Betaproteobacteria bacterium]